MDFLNSLALAEQAASAPASEIPQWVVWILAIMAGAFFADLIIWAIRKFWLGDYCRCPRFIPNRHDEKCTVCRLLPNPEDLDD